MREKRSAGQTVQHLRQLGVHPLALPGGEDDDVRNATTPRKVRGNFLMILDVITGSAALPAAQFAPSAEERGYTRRLALQRRGHDEADDRRHRCACRGVLPPARGQRAGCLQEPRRARHACTATRTRTWSPTRRRIRRSGRTRRRSSSPTRRSRIPRSTRTSSSRSPTISRSAPASASCSTRCSRTRPRSRRCARAGCTSAASRPARRRSR